ncbi:MAG: hypothetical protein WC867_03430 [Candidatus Pacearchaeota archaeon]|jgi:hypothetical protein
MNKIGFSTGILHSSSLKEKEKIKLFKKLNCTAIELGFGRTEELEGIVFDFVIKEDLKSFNYVSIHAPWDLNYGNNSESEKVIGILKEINSRTKLDGIVIHPHKIKDYSVLEKSGLPILIENMSLKICYKSEPKFFNDIKRKFGFNFVLDIQHAYDDDPSMNLARELKDAMGDRLAELHISGNSPTNAHFPTYKSHNREIISSFISECKGIPRILEGYDRKSGSKDLPEEYSFIKNIN